MKREDYTEEELLHLSKNADSKTVKNLITSRRLSDDLLRVIYDRGGALISAIVTYQILPIDILVNEVNRSINNRLSGLSLRQLLSYQNLRQMFFEERYSKYLESLIDHLLNSDSALYREEMINLISSKQKVFLDVDYRSVGDLLSKDDVGNFQEFYLSNEGIVDFSKVPNIFGIELYSSYSLEDCRRALKVVVNTSELDHYLRYDSTIAPVIIPISKSFKIIEEINYGKCIKKFDN